MRRHCARNAPFDSCIGFGDVLPFQLVTLGGRIPLALDDIGASVTPAYSKDANGIAIWCAVVALKLGEYAYS